MRVGLVALRGLAVGSRDGVLPLFTRARAAVAAWDTMSRWYCRIWRSRSDRDRAGTGSCRYGGTWGADIAGVVETGLGDGVASMLAWRLSRFS